MSGNGSLEHIRTVVFDWDDTLRTSVPHASHFFCDYVEAVAWPLQAEARRAAQLWEHRYWATSEELLDDFEQHTEGSDAFWLNYSRRRLRALGFSDREAEPLAAAAQAHMRDNYKPVNRLHPDTLDTLDALRKAGYALGVITNRSQVIYADMHELGLDLHFDFYLTGGQLGAYKPGKEIFENVLNFIRQPAREVLYVGD
ncbi:MAG TPA: HAD family hydrolase, partial [Anaerolineales bacterium]|nr:HAD family hydrolase [Anaerolineales bacterium]